MKRKLTYKKAGVDIEKAGRFKRTIKALVRQSFTPGVLADIGGFGSFFSLAKDAYAQPVLVSSTDGVGTKLMIAQEANKHDTVGIDLVAMNVNDILCTGARPLFFLDYIASGRLDPAVLHDVVKGITRGCIESGCALIGGETAEMPDMYKPGEYDLAGFCVGVVEKDKIIDGSRIQAGDVVIGLASSGLHSNGYSLVRKALSRTESKRMSKELLTPTRIYVKPVLSLLDAYSASGIAHITGGAFYDKIARILPDTIGVRIRKSSWKVPEIFRLIQAKAAIDDKEMYHTLNMGIGMVVIAPARAADGIIAHLAGSGVKSWIIGEAADGRREVEII